jgi:hypothetical protein
MQESLDAGKQQTLPICVPLSAAPTKDSPSEGRLDSIANFKDEARKVITKILELSFCVENRVLAAAMVQSMLNKLDSLRDREPEQKEPWSDYLQIGAFEQRIRDVLKEVRESESLLKSTIGNLAVIVERIIQSAEEK